MSKMEFFDTTKSIIENIYFLSGPLLAILGIGAIIQLFLTKKAIVTNSKREAANLAAQQIEKYNNIIIQKYNELFILETKENISRPEIEPGEFNKKYLKENMGNEEFERILNERMKIMLPILDLINSVEAFSTYFVKGVADEEIGFSAVGQTFCFSVKNIIYFDIASSKSEEDISFQNTIKLYNLWSDRLKKNSLLKKKIDIANKLAKVKNQKIDPIGTK